MASKVSGTFFLFILLGATVLISFWAFEATTIPSQLRPHKLYTKTHSNSSQDVSRQKIPPANISDSTEAQERPDTSQAPTGKKPIYVSDPTKAIICHQFSSGRLGNHLFEYASILGIASATNKTFLFLSSGFLGQALKHPPVQSDHAKMKNRCKSAIKLGEGWASRFDRKLVQLEPGKDYAIQGYLQSWLYFDEIKNDIRLALTFNDTIVKDAKRVVEDIRKKSPGSTLVGIHIRRGDLLSRGSQFVVASPEFLKRSMTYFRKRFNRVTFVVLGDDRKWNVKNIHAVNNDTMFPEPGSPAVDMEILSLTDHMVKSTGTFGWWAAFKNRGRPTVLYLKDFVKPNSWLRKEFSENADDHMLPRWRAMR